jgi:S-adenosyl methyltransferase
MMAGEPGPVPPGVDVKRANTARVYDYWLGGSHNFPADQELGRAISAVDPVVRTGARANRAFLGRAVRFLVASGIRQFLDIGSGIPTQGNVHEIAQRADPAARVTYVDVDPAVVAHGNAILAGRENTVAIEADLRYPETILGHPGTRRLIDFREPVGLLLVAVLHFIADADDPWRLVATLRDTVVPGSYLVLGQGTNADKPLVAQSFEQVYNRSASASIQMRSRAEILRLFDGFDLVDPGLAYVSQWRPESRADIDADPRQLANLVGVARRR